jgi:hypothetical protein
MGVVEEARVAPAIGPVTALRDPEPAPPAVPVANTAPLPVTSAEASVALPPPPAAPPDSAPEPAAAPARSPTMEAAGVRAALARYESAYSRLDADAAGAVWPALDKRQLARAFDGLESQRVDLGACDVRIAGEVATAECNGSASWTPKVGGGTRNKARHWQFRLRNTDGAWQIVGATVR